MLHAQSTHQLPKTGGKDTYLHFSKKPHSPAMEKGMMVPEITPLSRAVNISAGAMVTSPAPRAVRTLPLIPPPRTLFPFQSAMLLIGKLEMSPSAPPMAPVM